MRICSPSGDIEVVGVRYSRVVEKSSVARSQMLVSCINSGFFQELLEAMWRTVARLLR